MGVIGVALCLPWRPLTALPGRPDPVIRSAGGLLVHCGTGG